MTPRSPIDLSDLAPELSRESRTINLQSGGTLTLTAEVHFTSLSPEDRKLVFELMDRFDEYSKATKKT